MEKRRPQKFLTMFVVMLVIGGSHGQETNTDPISPLITFLQQLQRLRSLYTNSQNIQPVNNNLLLSQQQQARSEPLSSSGGGGGGDGGVIVTPPAAPSPTDTRPTSSLLNNIFNRGRGVNANNNRNNLNDFITSLRNVVSLERIFNRNNNNSGGGGGGSSGQRNFLAGIFNRGSN